MSPLFCIFVFMINAVRNTVLHVLNKDNNGYMTPDEFNNYARLEQLRIFEQYFTDYSRYVVKRNQRVINTGHGDLAKRAEEVIGSFYTEISLPYSNLMSPPRFVLPNNAYKTEDIMYNNVAPVEIITGTELIKVNQLLDAAPSADYPVGVVYENTDTVTAFTPEFTDSRKSVAVYPLTITSNVTCGYIRLPKDPKWTYTTLSGGQPIFDQSNASYQDFELPEEDMVNLTEGILRYAGISIREYDVSQLVQQYLEIDRQIRQ